MPVDHHLPDDGEQLCEQQRGILYAALNGLTCFAEGAEPWLVAFRSGRGLCLLDVAGLWPIRARSLDGERFELQGRPWSRTIYEASPRLVACSLRH